jgi:hypothetical protein
MEWSDLISQQPALGKVAHEALIEPGVLLIGTIRRDGSTRISGVEPLIMDGLLWVSMLQDSMKAGDLRRDSRITLNSIVTSPDPITEIKVRGTVRRESDRAVHDRFAATVAATLGWQPVVGRFTLFAIGIDDVTYIGYDAETRGQQVARWPADIEYIRQATTPTSLGPPRPVRRVLAIGQGSAQADRPAVTARRALGVGHLAVDRHPAGGG